MNREKNPLEKPFLNPENFTIKQHEKLAKIYLTAYYACNNVKNTILPIKDCSMFLEKFELHYDMGRPEKK